MFAPLEFYPPGPGIQPDNRADRESEEPGPSVSGGRIMEKSHVAVDLLDESEALEIVEFDPSVSPKDSWEPPRSMVSFLEKNFNRSCQIMKDFPKLICESLTVHKSDQEVTEQLKRKVNILRRERSCGPGSTHS